MQLLLGFLLTSFIGVPIASAQDQEPLTTTLYYESLCPGCIQFITDQLYSAWTKFKGRVLFDLVPYGNTEQAYVDGHWEFDCQHGPEECLANKIHACAIWQACGDTGTRGCDVDKLGHVMYFIYCAVKQPEGSYQTEAVPKCATTAGLDYSGINSCATGERGNTLINGYGNRTTKFHISGTPTVAINGVENNRTYIIGLEAMICEIRPQLCN